jgi:hypothetical protein
MTSEPRNNAAKNAATCIRSTFQKGNSGRPRGARHKATLAAEALLDGEAEAPTRKAIEAALGGDTTAMRLCLERILPARRSRTVQFVMPPLASAADAGAAMASIVAAASGGEISPDEAIELSRLVESFVKVFEVSDLERRLRVLEEAAAIPQ